MGIQQRGQNDGQQNKGMSVDPNWTTYEKEQYIAAYNSAKKKKQES